MKRLASLSLALLLALPGFATAQETLRGKVICGYQGWFRCEGDGANNGWHHYAAGGKFAPGQCNIEMWPDLTGFTDEEKFATPFKFADGSPASVFSSHHPKTVQRHFEWMRDHGIDAAFPQRFISTIKDKRFREPGDRIIGWCQDSARQTGRQWALMYDLTGIKPGEIQVIIDDWKRLVDAGKVQTKDAAYFRLKNKPLVALWGLGFKDRAPMLDEWEKLITFLRDDPQYGGCSLMLGVPYHWRTLDGDSIPDPKLHELLTKADVISPWAVGRIGTPQDAANRMEKRLKPDVAWCQERKVEYLPVAFPGFSWTNLSKPRGQTAKFNAIPRLGGQFLWSQAVAAQKAGAEALYVAMFDEMDEGTAIFKTTHQPPVGDSQFLAEPELPTDHYLWLTGAIGQLFKGKLPPSDTLPKRQP